MAEPIRISGDGKVATMIAGLPNGFLPEFGAYLDKRGRLSGVYDATYDSERNLLTIVSTDKFDVSVPNGGFWVAGKRTFSFDGVYYQVLFRDEIEADQDSEEN